MDNNERTTIQVYETPNLQDILKNNDIIDFIKTLKETNILSMT